MNTPKGQVPEALRPIQRYKIGYHSDDWGQRSSTPSGIPDASGSWVRYADHVAALAAGQATAAPAQPVAEPSYEHQRAIMEGERNASLDAYSRVIYLTGAESQLYEAGFTNGWQRASHGQAPAGTTEPTEQQILEAAEKAGLWPNTVHSWIPVFHRYHKELAKARPAPAPAAPAAVAAPADSELEDAARYRLLRRGQHWSVIDGIGNDLRAEVLDAAVDAARKQGATP